MEPKSGCIFQPFFLFFLTFSHGALNFSTEFLSVKSLEPKSGRIFFFPFELWNAESLEQKLGRVFFFKNYVFLLGAPNFGAELWSAESLEPKLGRFFNVFYFNFFHWGSKLQCRTLKCRNFGTEIKSHLITFFFFFFSVWRLKLQR